MESSGRIKFLIGYRRIEVPKGGIDRNSLFSDLEDPQYHCNSANLGLYRLHYLLHGTAWPFFFVIHRF